MSVTFDNTNDEWQQVVDQVTAIIEATRGGGEPIGSAGPVAVDSAGATLNASVEPSRTPVNGKVVSLRSIGVIRATGPLDRLRQADQYVRSIRDRSEKMVRIDVKLLEVSLNDSKARGIDLGGALSRIFASGNSLNLGLGISLPVDPDPSSGLTTIGGGATRDDAQYAAAVQLLGQYGQVELVNKPSMATLNGRPAVFSAGREFGFVSGSTSNVSNGTISTSIETQRLLVGIELSIKPVITADGSVYMEIVPIVSTLEGIDNYSSGGASVSQPRIVLTQLATSAIVRSGETMPLAGLITSRIRESKKTLPIDGDPDLGPVNLLIEAVANALERKELVALVTPTIVSR